MAPSLYLEESSNSTVTDSLFTISLKCWIDCCLNSEDWFGIDEVHLKLSFTGPKLTPVMV